MPAQRIVVMGPSGAGKSAVGARLAAVLALPFIDGDDLHPPANVAKMASGRPLDDDDRMPWLDAVGGALAAAPDGIVVACSALRRSYRDRIRAAAPGAVFVQLDVDRAELARRMARREHFMPPALLESQLAAFEPLDDDETGIRTLNDAPLETVVERLRAALTV